MKKRLIRRLFSLVLAVGLTILFIMLFTSGSDKQEYTYTVKKGDTLYSIAQDLHVDNWRKFAYETCKNNGLEQGGLIYPGQIIYVMVEGE